MKKVIMSAHAWILQQHIVGSDSVVASFKYLLFNKFPHLINIEENFCAFSFP